jgi:hypothetical protein
MQTCLLHGSSQVLDDPCHYPAPAGMGNANTAVRFESHGQTIRSEDGYRRPGLARVQRVRLTQ